MVQTTSLDIAGMSCDACVRHISRALDGMNGVINVDVNLSARELRPRSILSRRISDRGRIVPYDQDYLMAQVLELPQLAHHDRESEVDMGSSGINSQLHLEGRLNKAKRSQVTG